MARRTVPGTTYLLTRRCVDRRFHLRPSAVTNEIVRYALAHAAQKHGVRIHALVFMSNHEHLCVTDVRGVLPAFLRDFHRDVALALKAVHGIAETVWSDAQTSAVDLINEAAQLEASVYTVVNPVAACLVATAAEWPGAVSLAGEREIVVTRPAAYFGKHRAATIRMALTPPPGWSGSEEQWHERLGERVATRERELAIERRRDGRGVLGRQRVLQQSPLDRPAGEATRRGGNPVVAAGGDREMLAAALASVRRWREAYRAQRELWVRDKTTTFPPGTWWVVQHAGAVAA